MNGKKPMEAWLNEYANPKTRKYNKWLFKKFLAWCKKTDSELVKEFEQKKARNLILSWQKYLMDEKGYKQNTVRTHVNTVRAFFTSQCETVKGLKRKVVAQKGAKGEHIFSLLDLKTMREVGDFRDKAMLSTACSLGWETSAFLDLDREFVENLVDRAKSQKQDFIAFDWVREKTTSEQFGILVPTALHDLEKYLETTKEEATEKLFDMTPQGLNYWLRSLVEKAKITTIGKIRFHLIRKWLMSTLSDSGLNAFEVKLVLGKNIPITDRTYLQTLKTSALEKVKNAYPTKLSLVAYTNNNAKSERLLEALKVLFTELRNEGILRKMPLQKLETVESILGIEKEEAKEETKEGS